ncbi:MAG: Hpt domain-containing protein [Desulfobacteraceae bacterium]|nr:Hpt domain-containing protein [Desulfobacteraceae bacterium]
MSEDLPIIDFNEALNRALGDVDFLKMMMDEFQAAIPDFVNRIEKALHDGDMDTLSKDAHQLKGSSANLAAKKISAVAMELEHIGKNAKDNISVEDTMNRLKAEIAAFDEKLAGTDWSSF